MDILPCQLFNYTFSWVDQRGNKWMSGWAQRLITWVCAVFSYLPIKICSLPPLYPNSVPFPGRCVLQWHLHMLWVWVPMGQAFGCCLSAATLRRTLELKNSYPWLGFSGQEWLLFFIQFCKLKDWHVSFPMCTPVYWIPVLETSLKLYFLSNVPGGFSFLFELHKSKCLV